MLIVAAMPLTEKKQNKKEKTEMTTNSLFMKRELCLTEPTEYISDSRDRETALERYYWICCM
jgi:hypothetical protein